MTSSTATIDDGLLLPGLDGSNPLGFLAALGVLRTLGPSFKLTWVTHHGTWVPRVSCAVDEPPDDEEIVGRLHDSLAHDMSDHSARILELLKTEDDEKRRRVFMDQCREADGENRDVADWLCASGSDFAASSAINQLQTARRDYFLLNLREVIARTGIDDLRRSLFRQWDYADPLDKQSLHLDPSEDRRHAYQWNQPSGDPNRKTAGGMLGANRLAIEAIPLFTSTPEGEALHTVGFTGNRSTNTRWTWPLWSVAASLPVVQSLLSHPLLQQQAFDSTQRAELHRLGIAAAFRTNRILVEKTPNFTPARRVA